MSKRHQWKASGKKTRTGQHRKARHKETQRLSIVSKQKFQKYNKKSKDVQLQYVEPLVGCSIAPILEEALKTGEARSSLVGKSNEKTGFY
jgi:hypothetical protein